MNAQVFVLSGPRQGETLTILAPPFVIGNEPADDFYVDPEATPEAAGRKLRFDLLEEGWELLNLGGGEVMVNQDVVQNRCRLRSGDVIRISPAGPELSFTIATAEERMIPESTVPPAATEEPDIGGQEELSASWLARNRFLTAFMVVFCLFFMSLMLLNDDQPVQLAKIAKLADQSVREGERFTLDAALTEIRKGVLVGYSLAPGAPSGMKMDQNSGIVSWTPSEEEGDNTHAVTVIFDLDDGTLQQQEQARFLLKVIEVDQPPQILPVQDYELKFEGDGMVRLDVAAVDPDLPANDLIYSIVDFQVEGETVERPVGFNFHRQTGNLSWKPSKEHFSKIYTVLVRVEEVSQAALWKETTFQIRLPEATVANEEGVSYLLTMEDKEGMNRFPIGNACAVRGDVLLTSGEVANLLQERKEKGWKIAAQQAAAGKTKVFPIKQVLVHKLFNELQGDESKQIYYDFGLLMIEVQDRQVAEMATIEDWAEAAPGMPLKCLAITQDNSEPLTRFDDPTAALYPAKIMRVVPFSTDPANPLFGSTVLLHLTGTLPAGCVGSPVLNEAGRILGVYAEKANIPANDPVAGALKDRLHYAAPGHYVTAWLKGLNLAHWTTPQISPTESSEDNE